MKLELVDLVCFIIGTFVGWLLYKLLSYWK